VNKENQPSVQYTRAGKHLSRATLPSLERYQFVRKGMAFFMSTACIVLMFTFTICLDVGSKYVNYYLTRLAHSAVVSFAAVIRVVTQRFSPLRRSVA